VMICERVGVCTCVCVRVCDVQFSIFTTTFQALSSAEAFVGGSCHVMAFGGVHTFPFPPYLFPFPFFFWGGVSFFLIFLIIIIHIIHSIPTPSTKHLPEHGRDTAVHDDGTSVLPCRGEQSRGEQRERRVEQK
jgi:hypothetical protein